MERKYFLHTFGLGIASLFCSPALAGGLAEPGLHPFADGDTVMFLGDSITHHGYWHLYIKIFYLTRYPYRRIRFLNSGISGDSTTSVLKRMDTDILLYKPNKVVVMLGMNNSGTQIYLQNKSASEIAKERARLCDIYQQELRQIVARLRANSDPNFIFVSPTIYDETAQIQQVPAIGKNDTLAAFTKIVKKLAGETQSPFIDFFTPMIKLNAEKQLKDPAFTVIGQDRIHPGPAGHQFMACHFLNAQHVSKTVSEVQLNWEKPAAVNAIAAMVSDLHIEDGKLRFICREEHLPYPVGDNAAAVLDWFPLDDNLNRQIISCRNAEKGLYTLSIDGTPVGSYTDKELKAGINIAKTKAWPQYQDAQHLYERALELGFKIASKRNLLQVQRMLADDQIDINDGRALTAYYEKMNKQNIYYGSIIGQYIATRNKEDVLDNEIYRLDKELSGLNQPKLHIYSIERQMG